MRPHILVPLLLLTLLCAAPAGAAPAAPATEHAPSSLYDSSSPTMPAGAISVHPYAHEDMNDAESLDDYDSEPAASIADPLTRPSSPSPSGAASKTSMPTSSCPSA